MALVAVAAIAAAGYWWSNRPPGLYVTDNSDLFPVSADGKRGFMNKSGDTVIPPQFDEVRGFSEGAAAVRVGDKWGYINTRGAIIITPQFDDASAFRFGRAAVKLCCGPGFSEAADHRFGFINEDGKYIGSPDLLWVSYRGFNGNFAPVKSADGQVAFLTRAGEAVFAGTFSSVGEYGFSEGVAPVASAGKWGFIDESGEWAVNPQFENAHGFSGGLAAVAVGGRWGYVGPSGEFAINPQFAFAGDFHDDRAVVNGAAGMAVIDREGRAVAGIGTFDGWGNFAEGLAAMRSGGHWGYIDSSGAMVIEPEFDLAGEFQNGLAPVVALGKEGYITTSGSFVIDLFPGSSFRQEKARLADEAKRIAADAQAGIRRFTGTWTGERDFAYPLLEIVDVGERDQLLVRVCYGTDALECVEMRARHSGDTVVARGAAEEFYKREIPTFTLDGSGKLLYEHGAGPDTLIRTEARLPNATFRPPRR